MAHTLPKLPFEMDALAPVISKETLEYHHGKHHNAYVTNLNKLIEGTEFADASLEDIIKKASGGIFNNGAQAFNHDFYWHCLSPSGGGAPKGDLAAAIDRDFGSFEEFKKQFTQAAATNFGSGWTWLVQGADGKLVIDSTSNAGNPIKEGKTPLLTVDVWEHAYYIDYRNARPTYLEKLWDIFNWDFAAKNMK